MDVPTFDGHLDYFGRLPNPQIFLDWLHHIDIYFTKYSFSESDKVRFATTKLTGQASQYWTELVKSRKSRRQQPIETWFSMTDELKGKYVPPYYFAKLLDNWRQITQSNKPAKDYVNEFDEFLTRYNIRDMQSDIQIFAQFRAGLRENLVRELWNHGVTNLKRAYVLVQDLDAPKSRYTSRSQDHQAPTVKSTARTPTHKVDTKDKGVESNAKDMSTKNDFSKLSPIIKCYKCQGYGHVAANCPTPFRVVIDKLPVTESTFISEELILQAEEPENYDSDEEIQGDEIEESNTSIPLEVIQVTTEPIIDVLLDNNSLTTPEINPVIKESTDVSLEDHTSSILEITPVITESNVVSLEESTPVTLDITPVIMEFVHEDLTDTLPPTREIQPAIELVPRVSLPDFGMEVIPHLETSEVLTSLEVRQQCLIPTDVHVYTDPFWNYVVTKDLSQIKDVTIYDQSVPKILVDAIIGKSDTLQIIFSSTTIEYKGAFPKLIPVCIYYMFTAKTCKLSHTLWMRHLIIPFDRGRKNC